MDNERKPAAEIELTGGERVHLVNWLGQRRGVDLAYMRTAFQLIDRLELNETEQAAIGYVRAGDRILWKQSEQACKTFELSLDECIILRPAANEKSWPMTREVMALLEKLAALPPAEADKKP